MKKTGYLLVLICLFTLGMGSMGGDGVKRLPEVDQNFSVTVVDQSDVSLDLEKFSFEGNTFLTGALGKAQVSIEFEKIKAIYILKDGQDLKARVNLKDGKVLEIKIEKKKTVFRLGFLRQCENRSPGYQKDHFPGKGNK